MVMLSPPLLVTTEWYCASSRMATTLCGEMLKSSVKAASAPADAVATVDATVCSRISDGVASSSSPHRSALAAAARSTYTRASARCFSKDTRWRADETAPAEDSILRRA